MNTTLFVFPLIVAYLLKLDPSYTAVELFFVLSAFLGLASVGCLWYLDARFNQNTLESLRLADEGRPHEENGRNYVPLSEESF